MISIYKSAVVILVLLITVLFFAWPLKNKQPEYNPVNPSVHKSDKESSSVNKKGKVAEKNNTQSSNTHAKTTLQTDDSNSTDGYSLYGAENIEDILWLKKNGFPSNEQINLYQKMTDEKLKALSYKGDLLAAVELGIRYSLEGRIDDSREMLISAAASGSIHAIHQLSNNDMKYTQDIISHLAWKRVAYMMGDWSTTLSTNAFMSQMTEGDRMSVELLATAYYHNIYNSYINQYGVPLPFNVKPGFREALETIESSLNNIEAEMNDSP